MPSALGGRVGFALETNHVFPQAVLAPVTLVGGVVGVGDSKACAGHEEGLPLGSLGSCCSVRGGVCSIVVEAQ